MSYVTGLRCRECGTAYPREARYVREECFGPLEVVYDDTAIRSALTRERIAARPEGIFTEPAGGTTVAVTKKLIEQGRIPRQESIVICVTGNGYKTLEAVTTSVVQPSVINARLQDFDVLHQQWAAPRAQVVGH